MFNNCILRIFISTIFLFYFKLNFSQNQQIDSLVNIKNSLLNKEIRFNDSIARLSYRFYQQKYNKKICSDSLENDFKTKKQQYLTGKKVNKNNIITVDKSIYNSLNDFFISGNHNVLKINIIQLITNEVSLCYERIFKNHIGIEVSSGIIYNTDYFKSTPNLRNIVDNTFLGLGFGSEYFENSGFIIRCKPKYYFTRHFFLGINSFYKNIFYKNREILKGFSLTESGHTFELRTDKYNILGLSFICGIQTIKHKRFFVDFYFGHGFEYKTGKEIINDKYFKTESTKKRRNSYETYQYPISNNISEVNFIVSFGINFAYLL